MSDGGRQDLCQGPHTSINETGEKFFNELRRKTYTTPKSYLDLIGMYSSKLGELQGRGREDRADGGGVREARRRRMRWWTVRPRRPVRCLHFIHSSPGMREVGGFFFEASEAIDAEVTAQAGRRPAQV